LLLCVVLLEFAGFGLETKNMNISCDPTPDDWFGPVFNNCRDVFDFTLLFEQSILSIGPSALLLVFFPVRIVQLLRSDTKTVLNSMGIAKAVSCGDKVD
jgi:ATP-binding cassette subfamily C (CFTR/MRP) protein 1